MLKRKSIPNAVTAARLVSIPVLWGFAFAGQSTVVGAGFFFAWLTDALDGSLARVLDARTEWGSRFDSLTDALLFVSGLVWIVMLRPDFVREHVLLLATWLAIGLTGYLVGWLRFRRIADVHLYSAKLANFAGFLFVAWLLAFESYPPVIFHIVIGVCIWAATETLLVFATFERVDENVVTFFQRGSRGSRLRA